MSLDALVDGLWPHEPPPSARITVQGYLSVLRRALEPDRPPRAPGRLLVRDGTGYALRLDPSTLDADRFGAALHRGRDLLAAGDPRSALDCFDEALGWWRGPAYADCADRAFVVAEAQRLRELRTAAVEHRLAALVELGAHETAAAQLRAFLAEHPLRERAWALLARALYLTGRQGDALEVLRDARRRLMDDLGVRARGGAGRAPARDPGPHRRRHRGRQPAARRLAACRTGRGAAGGGRPAAPAPPRHAHRRGRDGQDPARAGGRRRPFGP